MALGLLWLLDAALQAQPDLFTAGWWRDTLAQSVMGQPSAINHSIFWAVGIIAAHASLWNSLFVATQAALGITLLAGRWERPAILLSIPWALGIWWVGEGFGILPTGFAMAATGAPGAVILYPVLALLAWPRRPLHPVADGPVTDGPVADGPATGVWMAYWLGTALLALPWAFPAVQAVRANISELGSDGPSWLEPVVNPVQSFVSSHAVLSVAAAAAAQIAIGLGILVPRYRRSVLSAALLLSALYWVCFQGLGGVLSGFPSDATDVQTAPLIALLALALWPVRSRRVRLYRLVPPPGAAIRSNRPIATRDIASDPTVGPWRAEALGPGVAAEGVEPRQRLLHLKRLRPLRPGLPVLQRPAGRPDGPAVPGPAPARRRRRAGHRGIGSPAAVAARAGWFSRRVAASGPGHRGWPA